MVAAYALLGLLPEARSADPDTGATDWTFDTSILSYSESNRISIFEPSVNARRGFDENRALTFGFTLDTVTGATPIGTLPTRQPASPSQDQGRPRPNTFTASSGGGGGGGGGGAGGPHGVSIDVPTARMADVRYGVDTSWQQPVGLGVTGKIGGSVSLEKDFQSFGANALLLRDFNRKNTTLSLGVSPEWDKSQPSGGTPIPLADTSAADTVASPYSTKRNVSLLAGVTQIITPRLLMQWNYTQTDERGVLSDPYKLLSVIDPVTGDPLASRFDSRPGARTDRSVYWLSRYHLDRDVVSASLRHYWDDWGIGSNTIDLGYHWKASDETFVEPHIRYYHQSAADFYRIALLSGDPLPDFASSDYRLSRFDAYTLGLRYGMRVGDATEFVLRFDYYIQKGNSHPSQAVGIQQGYDLFPALQALVFQAQLSFDPGRVADDFAKAFGWE